MMMMAVGVVYCTKLVHFPSKKVRLYYHDARQCAKFNFIIFLSAFKLIVSHIGHWFVCVIRQKETPELLVFVDRKQTESNYISWPSYRKKAIRLMDSYTIYVMV